MGFTTAGNGSPQILEARSLLNLNNILFYHNSGTSTILNLLKCFWESTRHPLSTCPHCSSALGHHRGLQRKQHCCALQWSFFAPHFSKVPICSHLRKRIMTSVVRSCQLLPVHQGFGRIKLIKHYPWPSRTAALLLASLSLNSWAMLTGRHSSPGSDRASGASAKQKS